MKRTNDNIAKMIALACIVSLLSSCMKDEAYINTDKMPPYSESGVGTIACKVNGDVFIPQEDDWFWSPQVAELDYGKSSNKSDSGKYRFHLSAMRLKELHDVNDDVDIYLLLDKIRIGTYKLEENTNNALGLYHSYVKSESKEYETNQQNDGSITIRKLDTINKIMSGTFHYNAIFIKRVKQDSFNNSVIHITDGVFDMHYQ